MLDAESDSDEINISEDITTTLSGAHYIPEDRRIVDQGSGGYVVIRVTSLKKQFVLATLLV